MPVLGTSESEGDENTDNRTADSAGDDSAGGGASATESRGTRQGPPGDNRQLSLPTAASDEEAAALAAAVKTHLDRERERTAEEEPEPEFQPWKLAGRLDVQRRNHLPRSRPRGGAWKAVVRSR